MMILALIVFILLSAISFYPLLVKKEWRELSIPLAILLIASAYAMQYYYDFNILPNPGNFMTRLHPLAEAMYSIFH